MNDLEIERLAHSVTATYRLNVPVDLQRICAEEGILLAPGNYQRPFHGRIEFLPDHGLFVIYYPEPSSEHYPGRVRFSLAHELGHYFIDEHRTIIQEQRVHNSVGGFRIVRNRIEHEANMFASALLIPKSSMDAAVGRRGFLDLEGILALSERCHTSAEATAFRYINLAEEPCVALVSQDGRILYSFSSDAAENRGFKWLGNRTVPDQSQAAKCAVLPYSSRSEGHSHTSEWFSDRRAGGKLWEESILLGKTRRVLTLLSWPEYKQSD